MAENLGKIAEAFVELEADLRKIADQLKGAEPTIARLGAALGEKFDEQFAKGLELKTSQKRLEDTGKKLKEFGEHGRQIGTALTVGVTAPLVGAGAAAIKFGGDFDAAMTESVAIMTDVDDAMRTKMSEAAKEMSRNVTFSATEGAEALFFLASSGLSAEQSIGALPVVAKFAQAGAFNLATATELLGDSQSALGLRVDDAAQNMENMIRVSDTLTKANILSNATVQEFAEALTNRAAAALRLVNKDVEEGVAVLAAYAAQGTKGATAGEQMAIAMRDLQSKAIENRDVFQQMGVAVFDSSGSMRNMADIVGDLEKLLEGASDEQKKMALETLGFQDRSVAALLTLVGMSDAIRNYEKELRSAGGVTEDVAKKQLTGFNNQMKLLQNEVELAGIELFESLAPVLRNQVIPLLKSGAEAAGSVAKMFAELPGPIQKTVIVVAGLAAALGPVVFLASSVAGNLGILLLVFGKSTVATGLLTASITALKTGLSVFVTASAGAVVAAGLLGFAIGSVANEFETVRNAADTITAPIARWIGLGADVKASTETTAASVKKLEEALRAQGVVVHQGTMSDEQYRLKLVEVGRQLWERKAVHEKTTPEIQAHGKAAKIAGDQDLEFAKALKEAREQILGVKAPTKEFLQALTELDKQGKLDVKTILNMKDQIDGLDSSTSPLIAKYQKLIPFLEMANKRWDTQEDLLKLVNTQFDLAAKKIPRIGSLDAGDLAPDPANLEALNTIEMLNEAMKGANVTRDETIRKETEQRKNAETQSKGWHDAWSHAIGQVQADFGEGISKMIFEGDKFSLDLKNIFKQLGKSLVQFLVTDAFGQVLKGFSGLLGKISGSKLPGGGLDLAGLGAKIGGALGIGAKAGTAGTAAAGTGGAGAAIGGLATNPITIAAAGALATGLLIKKFAGQGRKTADKFVKEVENPFGASLANTVDAFNAARESGDLSLEEAEEAKAAIVELIRTFTESADGFAALGKTQAKVVAQSRAHLAELFGPDFEKILDPMSNTIDTIRTEVEDLEDSADEGAGTSHKSRATDADSSTPRFSVAAALIKFDEGVSRLVDKLDPIADQMAAFVDRIEIGGPVGSASFSPQFHLEFKNEFNFSEDVDPLVVRDKIIPEITLQLETAGRGVLERWARLLHDVEDGLTATV